MKKELSYEEVLKEIEENRNRSWYLELLDRNKDNLDDVALIYRGNKITYGKMFENMQNYAKSLAALGVDETDEIPICISNSPELVYILGAISIRGAKANIFGDIFEKSYIKEIVDACKSNVVFVEDQSYEKIGDAINQTNKDNIIITNLANSLKNGIDPFYELDSKYKELKDNTYKFTSNAKVIPLDKFISLGKDIAEIKPADCDLDDEFTTTYSSGSTNSNRPKGIVHRIRSFTTIGRYHDKEVSNSASMKKFTIQAHIPTHSNTDIISSISDTLMQGATLALEPIYNEDFFLNSLLINKPTYLVATTSHWISAMKKIMYDDRYKGAKLSNLLVAFAVGEPLSKGEEKFLNKGLRKAKAGRNKIPAPVPITMCVAGGDCEHGGIFWTLFRSLKSKVHGKDEGLGSFNMVDVACLDKDGNKLGPNQYGRLVANSPCTMKEYKNNKEATDAFFIQDADGKTWGDLNVYGYIDENNKVFMKGRILDKDTVIPPFIISDCIGKDTKNIMSCEVVEQDYNDDTRYVAHIECQPGTKKGYKSIILSTSERCKKELGEDLTSKILYRIHDFNEGFELTGCGKRSLKALKNEKITPECLMVNNGDVISISDVKENISILQKKK